VRKSTWGKVAAIALAALAVGVLPASAASAAPGAGKAPQGTSLTCIQWGCNPVR